MLELKLIPEKKTPVFTESVLVDLKANEILCDTLEDTIRDINGNGVFDESEKKIYGETAIPSGVYPLKISYSPKFKKNVVEICDVSEFTKIYFHFLATVKQSLGCVGVGEKNGEGRLRNTGMTDKLVKMLEDEGGEGYVIVER